MFPFWELAVAPILDAISSTRVIEIGALRGENTVLMLERLGPGVELHVVDPVPDFDPAEHEQKFPGRYVFHKDLSLNVIRDLPPMDVALLDGDHNWYTVVNECRDLAKVNRDAGRSMPVMVLHDVLWPYGRRDLYYNPPDIPDEHRQTWDRRGMSPHKKKLLQAGGLNAQLANAVEEGGPRNGVMTGLEDFIAEYDRPLRLIVLPIYFGLAIVAEEETIAANPELAAHLDFLESAQGRFELLELSERIRIEGAVFQQNMFAMYERKIDAGARRYLDLLKGALLDEHYVENELRIAHLLTAIRDGAPPSMLSLRDPRRLMRATTEHLDAKKQVGEILTPEDRDKQFAGLAREREIENITRFFPFTTMGRVRIDHLETLLDDVRNDGVPGDLVECGTGRGGGAIFMRGYLDAHEILGRKVWVADRFRGEPGPDDAGRLALEDENATEGLPDLLADLNIVREGFERFNLLDNRVRLLQGDFEFTLPEAEIGTIALLRIGGGLRGAASEVLDRLYSKVAIGGIVVVDDYVEPECAAAVDAFRSRVGADELVRRIDWAGIWWRKEAEPALEPEPELDIDPTAVEATPAAAEDGTKALAPSRGFLRRVRRSADAPAPLDPARAEQESPEPVALLGSPLAPVVAGKPKDLSVVIVFYNMQREARRTLHSLSRAYQQGADDIDYEVIVVENGSDEDQKLSAEFVASFGPEFRYLDLGAEAHPSPCFALNEGVARSSGRVVGLMIDGAHILTPGVLHHAMNASDVYAPAVVSTQQWYVGPGQQPDAILDGYDQQAEDELFLRVEWPANGYRLFEIGHFIGTRDWLDGVWESNCIFVPRSVLERVGGLDESFTMAGGGFSNLELYERLAGDATVHEATILGEGSFHQVHGGTTTNDADVVERRDKIRSYADHYAEMRGRGFRGPNKTMHFVGTMSPNSVRSRARRQLAPAFFTRGMADDPDALPPTPVPIPESLANSYIEAYWQNQGWKRTSWLGRRVARPPADLITYHDLIHEIRPNWVINSRTGDGGRAMFLASMCDLVGHGQVLSLDIVERENLPEHPRITYLTGTLEGDEMKARIREHTGTEDAHVLALLGASSSKRRMQAEFDLVADLIQVGSYAVFENTIYGGHPVWPSFGPGPHEATIDILAAYPNFVADTARERFGPTFNPGGFLKRVR